MVFFAGPTWLCFVFFSGNSLTLLKYCLVILYLVLQHRVRLAKSKRGVDAIQKEGENLRAVWSPDTKLIAVIVSV